ncbi:unnamed protein product [Pelagomonas calceolata]|uniref:CS domain-containing protein n=3 Tax=Pelagomonas calceolata TaxID=35677 RepID=A0A8J2T0X4_9STRA|nr:unnamed protein product [Pelagomonas calceolata]
MSAQMQQHKAHVRKTMRQASSENTFALEELADELKDAKNCLTRAKRPHVKALLAAQIRYAAAEELRLLSGDDAPASVPNDRMAFSADAENLAADLAEAKTLLARAKRQETKSRLVAYVRAATAREVEVLAAQNTPKAEPSKEHEPQDDAPKAEAAGYVEREPSPEDARALHALAADVGVKAPPKKLPPSKGVVVSAPVEARKAPPAAAPRFDRSGAEAPPPLGAGADVPDRVASIWEKAKQDTLADEMEAAAAADRAAAEAPAPAPPRRKADPPRSRAFDGCKKGFLGGSAPAKKVTEPPPPPPVPTKKPSASLSDFARKLPPAKDPQMHHRRAAAYERHREREAAEKAKREAEAEAKTARAASQGAAEAAAVLEKAAAAASKAAAAAPAAPPKPPPATGNDPKVDALASKLRTMGNSKRMDEVPNCPPPQPISEPASTAPRPLKARPPSTTEKTFVAVTAFGWEQGDRKSPWARVSVPLTGVAPDQVTCSFGEDAFDLQIRGLRGKDYRLRRNALGGNIDPAKSSYSVSGGRVVVKLRKVPLEDGSFVEWEELSCPGGDREKAVDNAPRKPGGEPYDIARKLYETGNPIIREKIGAAATRHRDRIFAQGCDSPLEDVLKEHGGKLEEILRRNNPLKEKLFDSGLGE